MILADTNIVIDYGKGQDAKLLALIPTLSVAVCGVTRAEVFHGVRTLTERTNMLTLLATFHQIRIPDALWDGIGDNLALLRSNGITIPFPDVVIATLAIFLGIEVWTRDQHFALIQSILPALKLFQEPP